MTGTLTVCVLTLENGFTVTGESACASPENYNEELGNKIARRNAFDKIWSLEGYLLKENLFEETRTPRFSFQDRVVAEREELAEKLEKLEAFENGEVFGTLPESERTDLISQICAMSSYKAVLDRRISRF